MTLIDDMHATENIVRNEGVYRKLVCPKCGGVILLLHGYVCEGNYRETCDFSTRTLGDLVAADASR